MHMSGVHVCHTHDMMLMFSYHVSSHYPTPPVQHHSVVVISDNNPLWQIRFQGSLGQLRR